MHIGYVLHERPPFSALNFCSGAYHFHKLPTNLFRSITILHILADFAVPETIIFKISFISSPPTAGSLRSAALRVSSRPERQPDASWHFRRFAFSRSKWIKLILEPRILTAQARSGAPHFHARPGARSGALAHFSLCRGTYLPTFGGNHQHLFFWQKYVSKVTWFWQIIFLR